jgi:cytochrome c-type biogenesis protein
MVDVSLVGFASLAFGAGVATFFSPCTYALLPGYVGYYLSAADDEGPVLVGAALRGLAAVAGVAVVFLSLAAAVFVARPVVEPLIDVLAPAVGVALIGFGVAVVLGRGPTWHVQLPDRRASVLGFALFGAVYAVAAAGCVAPLFLAIVVRAFTVPPAHAVVVLGAYTAGFGVLVLGATVAIAVGRDALLEWLAGRRSTLNRVAGVALVLAGIGQLFVAAPF